MNKPIPRRQLIKDLGLVTLGGLVVPKASLGQIPLQHGFFKRRAPPSRFIYEMGSYTTGNTIAATRGSTHLSGENLAYVGFGGSTNSSSRSFSNVTWDGAGGTWATGGADNGDAEHVGAAMGMINVNSADYDKNFAFEMSAATGDACAFIRLIGGAGPVAVVEATQGFGQAYPRAISLAGQAGDIAVVFSSTRFNATNNVSCSGMNLVTRQTWSSLRGFVIHAVSLTGAGFNTTISGDTKQQWGYIAAVFRAGL